MSEIQLFESLKLWLKRLLIVYVAALAAESLACLLVIALAAGAGDDGISGDQAEVVRFGLLTVVSCSFLELAVYIVIAVLFLRMLYKAVERARGFTPSFTYVSPGWAVGYWFIPIMGLYRPFQIMQAWFKACAEQAGGKPAAGEQLLSGWWGMFLISSVVGWIVGRQDPDFSTVQGVMTYAEYTLGANLLFIVAATLFWLVIKRMLVALAPSAALV